MKISFSYKQPELREQTEEEVQSHLEKLERFLKRFSPDLVQLHGAFAHIPHRNSFALSLNLSLPTGTLHATGQADDVRSSVRAAFIEVTSQLKKHMARLRRDHQWRRKRGHSLPSFDESSAS